MENICLNATDKKDFYEYPPLQFTINTAYQVLTIVSEENMYLKLERMLNYIYIMLRKALSLANVSYKITNMYFLKKMEQSKMQKQHIGKDYKKQ